MTNAPMRNAPMRNAPMRNTTMRNTPMNVPMLDDTPIADDTATTAAATTAAATTAAATTAAAAPTEPLIKLRPGIGTMHAIVVIPLELNDLLKAHRVGDSNNVDVNAAISDAQERENNGTPVDGFDLFEALLGLVAYSDDGFRSTPEMFVAVKTTDGVADNPEGKAILAAIELFVVPASAVPEGSRVE